MNGNFSRKAHPSLVAVLHRAVLQAPSGLVAHEIAEIAYPESASPYAVMMAELTQPGRKLDADRVLSLLDATGSDAPLHFMARERGGVFVRLPDPAAGFEDGLTRGLAASIKEFGEFASEAARNIGDGELLPERLERIEKEGDEAIGAIIALKRLVRLIYESGLRRKER